MNALEIVRNVLGEADGVASIEWADSEEVGVVVRFSDGGRLVALNADNVCEWHDGGIGDHVRAYAYATPDVYDHETGESFDPIGAVPSSFLSEAVFWAAHAPAEDLEAV
ncbi:hypothetical protein [Puerhibacterium puerhi]|uniref:hypothetical protein n=1 Tax=Puerhibacterium puerhi TaxID=2692623 RepID=UPI00135A3719|nr:hypothetical protein [Puerhibacterium puerhi]